MPTQRQLGRADIYISAIGLGCWQFASGASLMGRFWPLVPQETANKIVQSSLEGGIDWFDTAEAYGNGLSEAALSEALKAAGAAPDDVVVATKWWPFPRTARSIKRTIDERLEHLDPYSVDLHQIHQPYALSRTSAQMDAMADLVHEGKIRAVGVSNFSERKMRRAHAALAERGVALASNQVSYSLIDRSITETAREHDASIAQVALAWLFQYQGGAVVAVAGASKEKHVRDTVGAMELELAPSGLERIEEASRPFI